MRGRGGQGREGTGRTWIRSGGRAWLRVRNSASSLWVGRGGRC